MITETDLINAAGSQVRLLEVFNLPDTTDPLIDAEYERKRDFAIEEGRAVLTEYLAITFSDVSLDALPADEIKPLVILAARYAVLQAKQRERGRLDDLEADELSRVLDRLSAVASGASWPGKTRPAAQANIKQGFVARADKSPQGYFRR